VTTVLLAITWYAGGGWLALDHPLAKVPLIWEYTLGNWWEAMQALSIAVLGWLCAWEARDAGQRGWWAFGFIGLLGLAFSMDEMGSMHEHWTNYWMMVKEEYKHIALIPILAGAGLMFLAAQWAFWRDRALYGWMWLGLLLCFGFLGVLDQLEIKAEAVQAQGALQATLATLEEGMEVVAFTSIAALLWAQRHRQRRAGHWLTRRWDTAALTLVMLLALMAPALVGLRWLSTSSPAIDLVKRGDFGAVCTIAALALACWVVLMRRRHERFAGLASGGLVLVLLAMTIESSCHLRHILWPMHGGERRIDGIFAVGMVGVLLAVLMEPAWRAKRWAWAMLLAMSALSLSVWWVYKTPVSLLWCAWGALALIVGALCLPDTLTQAARSVRPAQPAYTAGSGHPASANPRSRSRQASQCPQDRPVASGS
jgi:hypothetical protein